jgi:ATP-dependent protease ClpP protease subunit
MDKFSNRHGFEPASANITVTDAHWNELKYRDVWFSAREAVELGLADEIGEFEPPKGGTLFVI